MINSRNLYLSRIGKDDTRAEPACSDRVSLEKALVKFKNDT
jgi:hypothetical protein